jgi:hypothetical protein
VAHFLEGYTGLTITIGAIITLGVVMQMTARIDWEAIFKANGFSGAKKRVEKPEAHPIQEA